MSGTHGEAVLDKLTKPKLVQLLLKNEPTLGSQITDLSKEIKGTLTYLKMLEADIDVSRTVNDRLVRGLSKQKSSAGKTPSILEEKLSRLLEFQILFIIVSLRKRCVVPSKRLVSKFTNGMFKPVITGKKRKEL